MLLDLKAPSFLSEALRAQDLLNAPTQASPRPATVLHGALDHVVQLSPQQQMIALAETGHGHALERYGRSLLMGPFPGWRTAGPSRGPSQPNGRYGAPIPTAPTRPVPASPWPSFQAPVFEPSRWGEASRWFRILAEASFEHVQRQLPELRASFATSLDDRTAPLDEPYRTPLLVERVGHVPVFNGPHGEWAARLADHLGRRPEPAWVHHQGMIRGVVQRAMYAPSDMDLTIENLRTVEALANEVHGPWVQGCGLLVRHLVPTAFNRHALARAIESPVRPVAPRRPSIAHAPLLRHLAQNPAWTTHPEQGLAVAQALYELGAQVDGATLQPPMDQAVTYNRGPFVHWLLDRGASVNRSTNGLRPVHLALNAGHLDLANDLLRRGSRHGTTSPTVSHAPVLRHLVQLLVDPGIDVNERLTDNDHVGTRLTVLHWAVTQNLPTMVEWLVGRGADPSIQDSLQRSAWDRAATVPKHRSTLQRLQGQTADRSIAQVLHEAFLAHERRALHEVLHSAPFPGTMEGVAASGPATATPAEGPVPVVPRSRPRL